MSDVPVEVAFTLPDEATAQWLDRMIHAAGGSPDAWLTGVINDDRQRASDAASTAFAELAQHMREQPRSPHPSQSDQPPAKRPRRPKPSSAWRTQPAEPASPVDDYLAIVGSAEEVERRFHKHLKALPPEVRSRCADALAVQSQISGQPVTEEMVASLIARMTARDGTTTSIGAQEAASPERIAHAFANDIEVGDTILRFHDYDLAAVVHAVESLPDGRSAFRVVLIYEQRPVANTTLVMDRTTSCTVLRPQTPD